MSSLSNERSTLTEKELHLVAAATVAENVVPAIELTNAEVCGWMEDGKLTEIHFLFDQAGTSPPVKYVFRLRNLRSAKSVLAQLKAALTQVWPSRKRKKPDVDNSS